MKTSVMIMGLILAGLLMVTPVISYASVTDRKQDLRSKDKDKGDNKGGGDNRDKDKEKGGDHDNRDKTKDKDKDKPDKPTPPAPQPPSTPPAQPKMPAGPSSPAVTPKKGKLDSFSDPYKDKTVKYGDPAISGGISTDKSYRSTSYSNSYDDDDDDSFWGEFFGEVFSDMAGWVFFGDHGFRYSSYPYNSSREPTEGVYISIDEGAGFNRGNPVALQFKTDYQRVAYNITSYGIRGKLSTQSSLTWDMSNQVYLEEINLPGGTSQFDSINYFDTHIGTCAFTADTNTVVDFGIGFASFRDTLDDYHTGTSVKLGIDYFPGKPWSLQIGTTYAAPGDQSMVKLNADIGYHPASAGLEWFFGYHNLINSRGDNLDGPVFGLALWF
ncbi:MAG: hypothetical protein HY762_06980 [Planctomycetes bacterium]|nr:hypothetical protein [Planctomycetota bacterium]